jgi:hypothetical protein
MIDLKITKDRFKNHFYYAKWLYIIAIVGAVFVFSIVYSVTEPQVPKNLKVDITIIGAALNEAGKEIWQEDILSVLPEDQQEVNIYSLAIGTEGTGGISVYEILVARMAAKEDDILILPKEIYDGVVTQGPFMNMDDYITQFEYPEEVDLETYKVKLDEDIVEGDTEPHYYGIPLDNVLGLVDIGLDPRGKVAVVLVYTENKDNVFKTLDFIMSKTESIIINQAQEQAEGA